ncbi:MAG: glutamate-1-semialdehyde 2,1-aminomutase [Pseudomonadota bacterium]
MTNFLFDRAKKSIVGGVNSPVRSFSAVGGTPVFIKRASGPYIYDHNDRCYIDYVGSWGPMILGHAHPQIIAEVQQVATQGLSFGAATEREIDMAEKVISLMPSIERIRFTNSGTEATMTALRVARGYTGRNKIIKFNGCYHGHEDSLLVKAGSGVATLGLPGSAGVPEDVVKHTLVAEYNDLDQVNALFAEYGDDIAAVIFEPVVGNANCIAPQANFLSGLRKLCDTHGSLLIADEVMTGFRVALGGAQEKYNFTPDITTLGKIIGGGMPVGAVGGRREIMNILAPVGPVYQAGTLSGNPVAMAAGLKTLQLISADANFHQRLTEQGEKLIQGILDRAKHYGIAMNGRVEGGMLGFWFGEKMLTNYNDIKACDNKRFARFFHAMLEQGIYLPPSAYEACFISAVHDDAVIEQTITAVDRALQMVD